MAEVMTTIAPRDVAVVCASVLEALKFEGELDLKGHSNGGRWGGILLSDWDNAIHVLLELVIDRPSIDSDHCVARLMHQVMTILNDAGVLRAAVVRPVMSHGEDTLRLNALALMVLFRRLRASPHEWPLVRSVASSCWDAYLPAGGQGPAVAWDELANGSDFAAAACEEECRETAYIQRQSASDTQGGCRRLIQELRGFVLLATLPEDRRVRPNARLTRAKRALFEQLTGIDNSRSDRCDWPPFAYFEPANILIRHLHFVASRVLGAGNIAYDDSLLLSNASFNGLLPSGEAFERVLHTLGTVAQVKDITGATGLLAVPLRNLGAAKAESWQAFLHTTRGPIGETMGLYCHLAIATGMAVTALNRYAAARPIGLDATASLGRSTEESLRLLRTLRLDLHGRLRGLAFCPFGLQNEVVLRCWLLCEKLFAQLGEVADPIPAHEVLGGVDYLLSCRAPNGLFHQRYRTNELDEGESTATSVCLGTLSRFARWLERKRHSISAFHGEDAERLADLQRSLAIALQAGAEALLELQHESGGFPTFAKTEREKHGLLATGEGPGAQRYLLYDAPGADIVGWCLEGLSELKSGADEVPLVDLPPRLQRDIDGAMAAAVAWLRRDFHPRAGWWARYGGGYIIGTALALRGLRVAGVPYTDPMVRRAAELLVSSQNNDGGWDQSVDADDPLFNSEPQQVAMRGDATSSHPTLTAWAIMALLDAGHPPHHKVVLGAVQYLLSSSTRSVDGWDTDRAVHSVMRGWYYVDVLQTRLRPVEALLRWALASHDTQSKRC
jgi:hypothetical protein